MTERLSHEEILKIATDFMEEHKEAFEELAQIERKELMTDVAQKCMAAARNVAEGSPTLGKLIREGRNPMQAKVFYEYGAVLRTLAAELGYDNYHVDGDHGLKVVNVKDILSLADELEGL